MTSTARDELFDDALLRRLEMLRLVARKLLRGRQRGERRARRIGTGLEFADHRRYVPGDDIRHLDWNVLLRLGVPVLQQHEEDDDLPVHVCIDVSDSMLTGHGTKLVHAMRLGAALAYVALGNLDRVGIYCFRGSEVEALPTTRGKAQIFKIFEFLARATVGGGTDLRASARALAARTQRPGLALVLSDFYDLDGAFQSLNELRFSRHRPVAIQVLDPAEFDPKHIDLRGDVDLEDAEGGPRLTTTLTPAAIAAYADAHAKFCKTLQNACRGRSIPYFAATTDVPFDDTVLRMFRAGGLLE